MSCPFRFVRPKRIRPAFGDVNRELALKKNDQSLPAPMLKQVSTAE